MWTKKAIAEMERCLAAMKAYQDSYSGLGKGDYIGPSNPKHAGASRSTMDVTKILAQWRKTPADWHKAK